MSQAHVEIVLVDMINLILMLHIFTFLGKTTVDFGSDYQIMGHGHAHAVAWTMALIILLLLDSVTVSLYLLQLLVSLD